jgi:hypothetical protein
LKPLTFEAVFNDIPQVQSPDLQKFKSAMKKENKQPLGTLAEKRATKREDKAFLKERFKTPGFDYDHLKSTR